MFSKKNNALGAKRGKHTVAKRRILCFARPELSRKLCFPSNLVKYIHRPFSNQLENSNGIVEQTQNFDSHFKMN